MTRIVLRFDDLCPTMNWTVWDAIERILDRLGVHPILAIVPENRDPKLVVGPENSGFWQRARDWQSKGWVIGQHGFRHLYDSSAAGLVPWWRQSEFAGHPAEIQRRRIQDGQAAMRAQGLEPVAWVAPSHSFDAATLEAVREANIRVVSDGVSPRPYIDGRGLTWIPVPPWHPSLLGGVWTRCIHSNQLHSTDELERFCDANRSRMMGAGFPFAELLAAARPKGVVDSAFELAYWSVFRVRRRVRGALRPRRRPAHA